MTTLKIAEISYILDMASERSIDIKPKIVHGSDVEERIRPCYGDRVTIFIYWDALLFKHDPKEFNFFAKIPSNHFKTLDIGIDYLTLMEGWDDLKGPLSKCELFNTITNLYRSSPREVVKFLKEKLHDRLVIPKDFSILKHIKTFEIPMFVGLPEDLSFLESVETYYIKLINPQLCEKYFSIPKNLKRIVVAREVFNDIKDYISLIPTLEQIDLYESYPSFYLDDTYELDNEKDYLLFKKFWENGCKVE